MVAITTIINILHLTLSCLCLVYLYFIILNSSTLRVLTRGVTCVVTRVVPPVVTNGVTGGRARD